MKKRKTAKIKRENKKKKIRRGMLSIAGIAGAAVLTIGGCYGRNTKPKENNKSDVTKQEEIQVTTKKERLKIEKENLLAFLKDMYIEQLEQVSGNAIITTEDIKLETATYEDYAFVNAGTGEIITHGDEPTTTEQKLINDGVSYDRIENLKVYKVYNTRGDIIDCITMKDGEPKKVTIGEQYGINTVSILDKMGSVIPDGMDCIGYLESGKESDISVGKANFMKSLEKFEKNKKNKKEMEKADDEIEL